MTYAVAQSTSLLPADAAVATAEPNLPSAAGLAGVEVANTRLSEVDGEQGVLIIAGERLDRFVQRGFEAGCVRLWGMDLSAAEAQSALGEARQAVHQAQASWLAALPGSTPLSGLRAGLAQLDLRGLSRDQAAFRLCAGFAVMLAAQLRLARGQAPIPPDRALRHAHDFLRMLRGAEPSQAEAAALDRYLCTVIEHGFNASTFAARVVASTGADALSAVLAAVGALSGPLHGGAPGPVLDMLDAVGVEERAKPWLEQELAAGRRIMGMGHRVYRVRDPRAAMLQQALEQLLPDAPRLRLAQRVEREAEALLQARYPGRQLRANVEMYTALLLDGLGLERDAFTAVFALARVAGWCAHYAEQRDFGTLIRPRARYIGERPG